MPNVNNASIVPGSQERIVDAQGRPTPILTRFFNTIVSAAAPVQSVPVSASPFTYVAGSAGNLAVSGGTVSSITLTRANTTTPTGVTAGLIPMANRDTVTITYSGLPTVTFIPG